MLWFLYGVIYSLFQAGFSELNRIYKVDNVQLNFLHSLSAVIIFAFLAPFMTFPTEPNFYFAAVLSAGIITMGCQIQLHVSSKYNGRVSSMWLPICIFVGFVGWIALFPETATSYLSDPYKKIAIIVALILSIFSIVLIRRNDIGWTAFLIIMPVGVTYGLGNILIKYILPSENILSQVLAYALIVYACMTILSFIVLLLAKKSLKETFSPKTIKVGAMVGFCSAMAYLFMLNSVVLAVNPSFTNMIGAMVPVWLMIYHRIRNIPDNASPLAGTAMVASAIILLYVTT